MKAGIPTTEAARKLKISRSTLHRLIAKKRISAPHPKIVLGTRVRIWTPQDIARVQKELPKVRNGRKKK